MKLNPGFFPLILVYFSIFQLICPFKYREVSAFKSCDRLRGATAAICKDVSSLCKLVLDFSFRKDALDPGPGGVLPYKSLMGMCRWMGSHFHNWSDYYGVAFLIQLLEWGRKFSNFGGKLGIKMGRFSVKKITKLFIILTISLHDPAF